MVYTSLLKCCTDNLDHKVIPYKSFNDWRAFTAELLGKVASTEVEKSVTQVRKVVGEAVTEVMELVATWHKTGTTEDLTKDTKELDRIYTSAVYIAQSLRRQRALWSIRFATRPELPGGIGTGPLRFDPASMKDERDDETNTAELRKCQVEVMITPALLKRGNMNGEFFDKEEAMRAAIVVLAGLD